MHMNIVRNNFIFLKTLIQFWIAGTSFKSLFLHCLLLHLLNCVFSLLWTWTQPRIFYTYTVSKMTNFWKATSEISVIKMKNITGPRMESQGARGEFNILPELSSNHCSQSKQATKIMLMQRKDNNTKLNLKQIPRDASMSKNGNTLLWIAIYR